MEHFHPDKEATVPVRAAEPHITVRCPLRWGRMRAIYRLLSVNA
jgi:hypothetical protein